MELDSYQLSLKSIINTIMEGSTTKPVETITHLITISSTHLSIYPLMKVNELFIFISSKFYLSGSTCLDPNSNKTIPLRILCRYRANTVRYTIAKFFSWLWLHRTVSVRYRHNIVLHRIRTDAVSTWARNSGGWNFQKVATTRALRFFDTISQTYERYGERCILQIDAVRTVKSCVTYFDEYDWLYGLNQIQTANHIHRKILLGLRCNTRAIFDLETSKTKFIHVVKVRT